ncbi:MAG: choice-of-anchor H family protein [Colwellia sp.]
MKNYIKLLTSRFSPILLTTLQLALILTLMMVTLPSFAVEADNAREVAGTVSTTGVTDTKVIQSYSSGQMLNSTNSTSQEQVLKDISQRVLLGDSDQVKNKTLNTTRYNVITNKHQQAREIIAANLYKNITKNTAKSITQMPSLNKTSRSFSDGTFVIYQGYAQLIEDLDADGYFQTFSVTFDADLITANPHDEAVVYAELYLSENGGPWIHYYSTDNFVIHGESSDDEFEVYSILEQGFNTNHYDVLIDLYEVGYPDIVASYSSDDNNSLYALPLESSDYDVEYVEYIHGGSSSVITLIMMITLSIRRFKFKG